MKKRPPRVKKASGTALANLPEPKVTVPKKEPEVAATEANAPKVTLLRDSNLVWPQLYMNIFVQGSKVEEAQFASIFSRAACKRAATPDDADLVVFTGGDDVNPALYDEEAHRSVSWSRSRDDQDIDLYMKCLASGIPMFGVCRGAQFLWVMNGHKLHQDLDCHYGDHSIWDIRGAKHIDKVSSVHHQACRLPLQAEMEGKPNQPVLVATARKSSYRWNNPLERESGPTIDLEAFFFRDTCCFGVQGHPEYSNYNRFAQWTMEQIEHYIGLNPDITVAKGTIRLPAATVAQRPYEVGRPDSVLAYLAKRK